MRKPRAILRALVALAGSATIAGAAGCGARDAAAPADPVTSRVAALQRSTSQLQRQIDLASGKDFYLVLDPAAGDITLMLMGAELQRYPVLGLQVGEPRVSWVTRPDRRPWQDLVWAHGELDPPRQIDRFVIQAAPPSKDGKEAETPIPPTPEEMYPVPSRYHVRFDDGLSIEIRPLEGDAQAGRWALFKAWLAAKWHDAHDAAFDRERDAVRLRIALSPGNAASLYRSLPPSVRLIILSGTQPAAPKPAATPKPAAPAMSTAAAPRS
jgi:hypothetical protein